ncbi:MAG TPA: glutamate-5-semialdehyde dehydrogenase, partial [Bacteroidales bacterium]|nr:glutamate-5-semialdehyde dehydrogenase [Bacteroidales bacterium]
MDCTPVFIKAKAAGNKLRLMSGEEIDKILNDLADASLENCGLILSENRKDTDKLSPKDPDYDRLLLTTERIKGIASDMRNIAGLPSPVGKIMGKTVRPNGLSISRMTVPFGLIGVVYEARPNVTFDVFALCLKSMNACILKGGSDAINSNAAIVSVIRSVLEKNGADMNIVNLLPAGREETAQLFTAVGYVDLLIPRGSRGLIDYVRENSKVPVIETGAGICHTYFDDSGDREKGRVIVNNAKTRRVSVCNALDCLIIHEKRLNDLPYIVSLCEKSDVLIYADEMSYKALEGKYPGHLLQRADDTSFGTEFLSYKMAVKTVHSINDALDHIAAYV